MAIDAWLPNGYRFPDGARSRVAIAAGLQWQILHTQDNGKVLVSTEELTQRWIKSGFFNQDTFMAFDYGELRLRALSCAADEILCSLSEVDSVGPKNAALAFATALRETREIDKTSPLQDALYVQKLGLLLPVYSADTKIDDDVVLGYWLTGGARLSAKSFERLRQHLSWMDEDDLREVIEAAGFDVSGTAANRRTRLREPGASEGEEAGSAARDNPYASISDSPAFELPGRPELEGFINEHIVDIIRNKERYQALGIGFPSAVVLHGPPGCGKTFAVERLVEFLGWPSFQIDASSIASPYIHETSRKVAGVFNKAIRSAPSVIVIDEMEAFLADREMGIGHHRVEEVAEFLRRIPEAVSKEVLIVAMTNRIEIIDPAILRRGRFDHVIKVDYSSEAEVQALLEKLLEPLPKDDDVDAIPFAKELAGRPLSDAAFIVREGARLAARSGKDRLDQASLLAALSATPAREREGKAVSRRKRIVHEE